MVFAGGLLFGWGSEGNGGGKSESSSGKGESSGKEAKEDVGKDKKTQ